MFQIVNFNDHESRNGDGQGPDASQVWELLAIQTKLREAAERRRDE